MRCQQHGPIEDEYSVMGSSLLTRLIDESTSRMGRMLNIRRTMTEPPEVVHPPRQQFSIEKLSAV
jgi:hypothetical protein